MEKHALVIGGTGMLAETVLWLTEQGYRVSVVGRSEARLRRLKERAGGAADRVHGLAVDYGRSEEFREALAGAIRVHGPVELVVSWIHSTAPEALEVVTEEVAATAAGGWRLFQVRGSNAYVEKGEVAVPDGCLYRLVILGFVLEGGRGRWLRNEEIASGVIEAVKQDREEWIVGTCEPWEKRPGW